MKTPFNRPEWSGRHRVLGLGFIVVGAAIFCLELTACSSARPGPPAKAEAPAIALAGTATGSTVDWRLTGQADSKSHCGKIEPPVEVTEKKPNYPDEIRRQGIAGSVVLQGTLSGGEAPEAFKIISSPDQRLTDLAVEAFRAWRYKPAVCDGMPIDTYITVTFSFKLNEGPGSSQPR